MGRAKQSATSRCLVVFLLSSFTDVASLRCIAQNCLLMSCCWLRENLLFYSQVGLGLNLQPSGYKALVFYSCSCTFLTAYRKLSLVRPAFRVTESVCDFKASYCSGRAEGSGQEVIDPWWQPSSRPLQESVQRHTGSCYFPNPPHLIRPFTISDCKNWLSV